MRKPHAIDALCFVACLAGLGLVLYLGTTPNVELEPRPHVKEQCLTLCEDVGLHATLVLVDDHWKCSCAPTPTEE